MKGFGRKILSAILATTMLITFVPASAETVIFGDINGHWAEKDIIYLYNAGLISGMSSQVFAPDDTIDKAQFITMIVRALKFKPNIYSVSYSDVMINDDWFAGYLGAAIDAGIIKNSNFAFIPDEPVSRAYVANLTYKVAAHEGLTKNVDFIPVNYSDVSDEALAEELSTLSSLKLMVGKSDTEFAPDDTLTRAEAAALVKRVSLAAGSVGEVSASLFSTSMSGATAENGVISLVDSFAWAELDPVDFHYGINTVEASVAVSSDDLQLEIWLDAPDTMTGTKVGTIVLKKTDTMQSFTNQRANINKTFGSRKIFVRLIGDGEVKVNGLNFITYEKSLNLTAYSKLQIWKKSGGNITNLNTNGYMNFDNFNFGDGYNYVEISMKNSVRGQLIELWANDVMIGVVETVDSGDDGAKIYSSVVKAKGSKNLSFRTRMKVGGTITGIKFFDYSNKADLFFDVDNAETSLSVSDSNDYDAGKETEPMKDGDVIKFSNINMHDGFNILSLRMRKSNPNPEARISLEKGGVENAFLLGVSTVTDDNNFIEVRLDSENGPIVGIIKENPIPAATQYDVQTCYLHGAEGLHDLYLKAVGDIGWNIRYIKLQERGWYDSPFTTYEAEDMNVSNGVITNPLDSNRYVNHTIEGESSGKANVMIEENGGYVEFIVPQWFSSKTDRTAITVRHSITDYIDENQQSMGQDGDMKISVNGKRVNILDSFGGFIPSPTLTLSSKYTRGYGKAGTDTNKLIYNEASSFFLNDAFGVIEGDIKPGDVIRFEPEINNDVTYCYIDCIELETIEEPKQKPENFLSITECGAVPNDGIDDGPALRMAAKMVQDDPYTYGGLWIPEGTFEILTYTGDRNCTAADFSNICVKGSGLWTSRLFTGKHQGTAWAANFTVMNGKDSNKASVIRDLAFYGTATARGWALDSNGDSMGAICFNGTGAVFAQNVWIEHYNCGFWVQNGHGVYKNTRIKNTWADGINLHNESDGVVYEKTFSRSNGDDALPIFSSTSIKKGETEKTIDVVRDITIRNNTVSAVWHASGITLWGAEDAIVSNNHLKDMCGGAGIALFGWGYETCGTDNVWIKNNRFERCGTKSGDGQLVGAVQIVPGKIQPGGNNKYKNTYFDNNEFIDNPYVLMRVSSQAGSDEVLFDMRYNYARNAGLAITNASRRHLINYLNSAAHGTIKYFYNVFEGEYYGFKYLGGNPTIEDILVGNMPEQWGK